MLHFLLSTLLLLPTLVTSQSKPQRGLPFGQSPAASWPNPSTERDNDGRGNIKTVESSVDPNKKVELGYMSCDDDLGWTPFGKVTQQAKVSDYLSSNEGQNCHCPRSGRWQGKLTNGTWFWDYTAEDWDVAPGVDGSPPIVGGKGQMSASSTWEFWSTDENGKSFETTPTGPPQPGERFWVAQEITIWGQPKTGAEWIPATNTFQSSKKFAELDADGNIMKDKDGNLLYKGSSLSVVFECQVLYTDTLSPDRRDQGCTTDGDNPCGTPPSDEEKESTLDQVLNQPPPTVSIKKKERDLGSDGPGPGPPNPDPGPPGPAPTEQFPHKMAWYMFLTASSGPCSSNGGECQKGGEAANTGVEGFKTCNDVNKDTDPQTCPNRDPTGDGYQWIPGANICPDPSNGFDGKTMKPLCPNCIPTTNYQGSDGGGDLPDSHHGELGQQAARDDQNGLPPCATKRDPAKLDRDSSPWENDFYSMCDFPLIASAMALPVNGRYGNEASRTFHWNGTITAGPPQDLIGGENVEHRDAHARLPGYPGPIIQDSAYDQISGPANSLMLCDGVFDHCTTDSEQSDSMDCAYGHTYNFLKSLNGNKDNAGKILGKVPMLLDNDNYQQEHFATLICVRNSWIKGTGYDPQRHPDKKFLDTCKDTDTDKTQWMHGSGPDAGDQKTACMKGGGWGWPYCPLNLPNMPAIKDEPPVFCYQEPQGAGQLSGHKFYYLACLSARFMPILDGLGGQAPDIELSFWIVGAFIFGSFGALWILFFVSIHKSEDEQEEDEEGRLIGLTSRFVQQQEVFRTQAVRRLKCGSCASPLDVRPVPKFCPFCNAPSTGYLVYEPRSMNWVKTTGSVNGGSTKQ